MARKKATAGGDPPGDDATIHDPERYAAMQIPHATQAEADAAWAAFFDAVYELRARHRIAEFALVALVKAEAAGGVERTLRVGSAGDAANLLPMLTAACGVAAAEAGAEGGGAR